MSEAQLPIPEVLLDAIAERVAAKVSRRLETQLTTLGGDRWMDSKEAAEYLGLPLSTLRKLTAEEAIPFAQDTPNGKTYFLRSELDRWRKEQGRGPWS